MFWGYHHLRKHPYRDHEGIKNRDETNWLFSAAYFLAGVKVASFGLFWGGREIKFVDFPMVYIKLYAVYYQLYAVYMCI